MRKKEHLLGEREKSGETVDHPSCLEEKEERLEVSLFCW